MRSARIGLTRLTVMFCCLATPLDLFAQAWLPPKGEGSVSIIYQNLDFAGHFDSSGTRLPMLPSRAQSMLLGVGYGITDKLALNVDLPYIATRFTGADAPLTPTLLDNRDYHGIFQDFRIDLRYSAVQGKLALAPSFTVVIPSHNYDTVGEAAQGRNLREGILGMNVGRTLGPALADAYIHGRYSYAVVEHVYGLSLNRSNADAEFGYFVNRSLSVRALTAFQRTHGGIHFPEGATTPLLFLEHDRILRNNYWHVGGAVTYSISPSVDVHGAFVKLVTGSDTHFGRGVTAGLTYRFSQRASPQTPPADSGQQFLSDFAGAFR